MRWLAFVVCMLVIRTEGKACDCPFPPGIKEALSKSNNAIFSGRIISSEMVPIEMSDTVWKILSDSAVLHHTGLPIVLTHIRYTIEVSRKYTNVNKEIIHVVSPASTTACGFLFQLGKEYIVYAETLELEEANGERTIYYYTTSCDRTMEYSVAEHQMLTKHFKR